MSMNDLGCTLAFQRKGAELQRNKFQPQMNTDENELERFLPIWQGQDCRDAFPLIRPSDTFSLGRNDAVGISAQAPGNPLARWERGIHAASA
jgi:hypothetical protein